MLQLSRAVLWAALALSVPAAAQTANPAFTPSGTPSQKPGVPAPHQLNTSDRTFVHQLAIGNAAEIELGKLAQQKASGEPIKNFAQKMIDDHQKAGNRIADLAKAAGLQLPSGVDDEHRALRQHLEKLSGTEFDVAYAQAQLQDHQKTSLLLAYEIGNGQDQALRDFAAESLPQIRKHLEMAQNIAATATPRSPQSASPPASPAAPPATTPGMTPGTAPQTPPARGPNQ
jgi:putative membrane protein